MATNKRGGMSVGFEGLPLEGISVSGTKARPRHSAPADPLGLDAADEDENESLRRALGYDKGEGF